MDITSIKLLRSLVKEQKETNELLDLLGIKDRRLAYIIKNLGEEDYIEKEKHSNQIKRNTKSYTIQRYYTKCRC